MLETRSSPGARAFRPQESRPSNKRVPQSIISARSYLKQRDSFSFGTSSMLAVDKNAEYSVKVEHASAAEYSALADHSSLAD